MDFGFSTEGSGIDETVVAASSSMPPATIVTSGTPRVEVNVTSINIHAEIENMTNDSHHHQIVRPTSSNDEIQPRLVLIADPRISSTESGDPPGIGRLAPSASIPGPVSSVFPPTVTPPPLVTSILAEGDTEHTPMPPGTPPPHATSNDNGDAAAAASTAAAATLPTAAAPPTAAAAPLAVPPAAAAAAPTAVDAALLAAAEPHIAMVGAKSFHEQIWPTRLRSKWPSNSSGIFHSPALHTT